MESRRRRVEQKGRFTITEIIPGSPYSPRLSSPTFQDDEVSVADFPAAVVDDAPASNGSCSEVATIKPQPVQSTTARQLDELEKPASIGAVQPPLLKLEEPPETHTQPPEAVSVPPVPIEATLAIMPPTEPSSVVVDTICEVSTPRAANAVITGSAAPGSPSRKYSSPKKSTQRARRVKRRGRFTIIELASDSPTSRKNADDLYDHRFVTTTSIGGSSVESAPQLGGQLSRSFDSMERRPKPKRATRSMPRLRQTSAIRRSRRRSASPDREFIESTDMVDPSGNQQQQQEAAAYAKLQTLPVMESADVIANVALTTAMTASTATVVTASTSLAASMGSVAISDSRSTGAIAPSTVTVAPSAITGTIAPSTVSIAPSAVRPVTPPTQLMQVGETTGNAVTLPQTSVTISAAQFLQQQQTIASLIRQQHDLKQIISVLQEQQQQLMTIPSQINELKRQRAGLSNGETREEELRELYMQVDKLTQSNESLHSLLNAAEREARHRTLEIECLSEENDELRHRCGQLESRYIDERKQSFMLEEELQRLRILSLTQQEQQLRQRQQQQNQKLTSSQTSVAVE